MLNQTVINLILLGLIIYLFLKNKSLEKMTATTDIRATVKEVYKADVQAIKNLGDFASTFLTADKKELNLPFEKVNITGSLNVNGQGKIGGNIETAGHLKIKDTFLAKGTGNYIRLLSDPNDEGSYNAGFASRDLWSKTNIEAINDIKTTNLYTENIGKHKGDGWLRINNIGNSASVALFGTMSINEHKGKGGLNVGSWNETGIGNGNINSTANITSQKTYTNSVNTKDGRCLHINNENGRDKLNVHGAIVLNTKPSDNINKGYIGHLFVNTNVYANAFASGHGHHVNTYKC